jgi:hypothetical protein
MSTPTVTEAIRVVQENLILLPAWDADRVREYLSEAVARGDAEVVRREAHTWSGTIALSLFGLADAIESTANDVFAGHHKGCYVREGALCSCGFQPSADRATEK